MTRFIFLLATCLMLFSLPSFAQDVTEEPTAEVTPETTAEITPESTPLSRFDGAGDFIVRLTVQNTNRAINVHIPESYDGSSAVPLVIVLHGASGNGRMMQAYVGFDTLSEAHNFIVVYPDGLGFVWNDGRSGDPRIRSEIDDVGFIAAVINFIGVNLNIDPTRVYVAGHSMGGMMSYRVGCNLYDRVAAVGSVASPMPIYIMNECNASRPIPLVIVHGTDDLVIPWIGIRDAFLSVNDTMRYWGQHNNCETYHQPEMMSDADPEDHTLVIRQGISDCADNANILLYAVYSGGHGWPGQTGGNPQLRISQDIDTATALWSFFNDHRLSTE